MVKFGIAKKHCIVNKIWLAKNRRSSAKNFNGFSQKYYIPYAKARYTNVVSIKAYCFIRNGPP
jgi:hypothetical protein